MLFLVFLLISDNFVGGTTLQGDSGSTWCPKHQFLVHDIQEKYYMDEGETIEVWAKLVHDPWKDNRLIGGVSDPSSISFNLSCVQQTTDFKGVVTRNMTAVIFQSRPISPTYIPNRCIGTTNPLHGLITNQLVFPPRSSSRINKGASATLRVVRTDRLRYFVTYKMNTTGEFEFYIKAFSENDDCHTAKVSTKIIVGCPVNRRLQIHGQTFEGCAEFKDYNYTIPRENLNQGNTSKVVHYDFENLGCPITSIINSHFKPIVHVYDNDNFLTEVTGDFLLWEKYGQTSYHYSRTMRQAGCIGVPQAWSGMIDGLKALQVDQEWKQQVHHSCFHHMNESSSNDDSNLDMPYEIMNSTGESAIIWDNGGLYVFKLRLIDPHTSFCDFTAEFAVKVGFTEQPPEHIPSFVVLGASCLGILLGTVAAYLIDTHCVR